MTCID